MSAREFRQSRLEYNLDNEIEDIHDLKLIQTNNILLVERIQDTSTYINSNIEVVKEWSAGEHAERIFKVVKAPKTVFFDPRYPNSNAYATDMEVKEGDTVFINLSESLNTFVYTFKGKTYHTIRYDSIVCAKRGDDIVPVNGYVLLTPIEKSRKVLEYEVKSVVPNEAKVAYIGSRNREYKRNYRGRSLKKVDSQRTIVDFSDKDLHVGDTVVLNSTLALTGAEQDAAIWPLEASAHRVLDKPYFVCQRPRIVFIR